MRALLVSLAMLVVPAAADAHREVVRTDLRAIAAGAELVARGRVVQVEALQGSAGPRMVSIVIERVLAGGSEATALTFRAPAEHGPGWKVGEHALFFLAKHRGSWHAAAIAAESPRVGAGGVAELEARYRAAVEPPADEAAR